MYRIIPIPMGLRSQTMKSKSSPSLGIFIEDYKDLRGVVSELRKTGKKIVLTQGVFDLLHGGHATYLAKAREQGDVLIVGIDSDSLTRKRKGPNRPIVPEAERITMLLHLRSVDIVTIRDIKHGIGGLIRLVRPDILVASKSTSDFQKDKVLEYKNHCKQIIIFPPQATTSTTARIRNLTIEGAEKLAKEVHELTEAFLKRVRHS